MFAKPRKNKSVKKARSFIPLRISRKDAKTQRKEEIFQCVNIPCYNIFILKLIVPCKGSNWLKTISPQLPYQYFQTKV